MKSVAIVLIALATGYESVSAARLGENPMTKVVTLLKDMKTKIGEEGKSEQTSYDKYACWCEDTIAEKAEDITKAKDKLEELENNIVKNKGGLGSGGATIAQLTKDIAENIASLKEATEVRNKEGKEYDEEKIESEQCIGALEAAIKVLTGAGAGGKKGFLETLQEAQLLSVVGSMRQVLKAHATQSMKAQDLEVVRNFVNKPEEFMKGKVALGAVQVGNNPFGDYAPQSSKIQGILKSMYDSFTSDIEKDNVEEAERQKAFLELKQTKEEELEKLKTSLTTETKTAAERTKSVADDKAMRESTREELDASVEFFKSTKTSCEEKSKHWAQRSRLRTQELSAITEAIEILDSDDAKKTFDESAKFFQISASRNHKNNNKRAKAYQQLKSLAARYNNLALAQIAVAVKSSSTGHFDDVIVMIDKMISELRQEEGQDIEHRDRCEGKQNKNKNDKADAENTKTQAEAEIERLTTAITAKEEEIKDIQKKMDATKKQKEDIKKQRAEETEEFKKAQKADADAIELLGKAKRALEKHYKDTKAAFVQAEPAPETNWQGGDREGSKGAARGIISILDMLVEDLTKEMKSQGQDEVDAQTKYEEERLALTRSYRASEAAKANAESEKADLGTKKADQTEIKDDAQKDIETEEALEKDIALDCNWVESDFQKRRDSRKAEIEGLNGARDFLAGAGSDQDLEMP